MPITPEKTPGFAWRVSLSILVCLGWISFIVLWLFFYASQFNVYQNLAVVLVSIFIGMAIMAAAWAPWGMKYGPKMEQEKKRRRRA